MPKILLVLPSLVIGGAETKTYNLIYSLKNFEKVLITQSSISGFFSDFGIKTHIFEDFNCSHPYALSPSNIFAYAKTIKKISDYEKPDIVLGIMHHASLFVTISKDIYRITPQTVITIEGNISAHFKYIKRQPTLKEKIFIKYCFTRATGIIVPSEGVREDLINNFGAKSNKVITIYNGIDIERAKELAKKEIPHKKDCAWIVTACRLNSQKDFLTLLKAFSIVRKASDARLFIIGEGELRQDIMKLVTELKLDHDVTITGFLKNPFPYIANADVFILSSFFEGFGNVIVEAMACGTPVISTDCPSGPSEIIDDGVNGFLVPVEGFHEMAQRCLEILNSNEIKKRLSYNGKKRAEDFSIHTMGKRFGEYFMNLLRS